MTIRTITYDDATHVVAPRNPTEEMCLRMMVTNGSFNKYCAAITEAPPFTSLPNHDLDVLQAENELFRAAIDADPTFGNMKPDLDVIEQALEIASDLSLAHASDVHITYAGYKPGKHAAVDAEVEKIKQAIAALKRIKGDA